MAAFCGSIELQPQELQQMGIAYCDSIMNKSKNLEDALAHTTTYLQKITKSFVAFLNH